ncbi:hypothetical protein BJV82DRAFT_672371 [Fennellomyces sp. T-0311]|nr:hypothetical protein BJV82DRAFT_672371 [Fennellomyces sp. T-0311]
MPPLYFAAEAFVISSADIFTRMLAIGLLLCEGTFNFLQRTFFPSVQLEYRAVAISMASDMGRALAFEYASQGTNLVLMCDHWVNLEKTAQRCRALGAPIVVTRLLNICNADAVTEFFDSQVEQFNIDLFIANAFLRAFDIPQLDGPDTVDIAVNYHNAMEGISAVFEASKRLCRPFQLAVGINVNGLSRVQPYTVDLMIQFDIARSAMMTFGNHLRELGKEFDIHVSTIVAEEYLVISLFHAAGWSNCTCKVSKRSASRIRRALAQDVGVVYPPADIYFYSMALASLPASIRQTIAFILE